MAFRVEITPEAEEDANTILDWLVAQGAGAPGVAWFNGLKKAIASLREMPIRCPLAPENARFSFEVRHLLYGRRPHVYRIVFRVMGESVYVLRIRQGHRKHLTAH
jgi:plasmid stabilization system protein ParE